MLRRDWTVPIRPASATATSPQDCPAREPRKGGRRGWGISRFGRNRQSHNLQVIRVYNCVRLGHPALIARPPHLLYSNTLHVSILGRLVVILILFRVGCYEVTEFWLVGSLFRISCALALFVSAAYSQGVTTSLALAGDSAPGGGTLFGITPVKLNNLGQVVFEAFTDSTSEAIFRAEIQQPLVVVARSGQSTGNGTLDNLNFQGLNNVGQIVLDADILGASGGGTNHGIYLGSGGALTEVIRTGASLPLDQISNGEINQKITSLAPLPYYEGPILNDSGKVAFTGHVSACTPEFDGCTPVEYDAAIRSDGNGTFGIAAKTGTAAPVAGGGTSGTYSAFVGLPVQYFPAVAINNAGQLLYRASVTGPNSEGIFWANISANFTQNVRRAVGRNGQTNFPGPPGTLMVETQTADAPIARSGADMNDAGQVAFVGELHPVGTNSADHGVFLWSPQPAAVAGASGLTAIARSNQASPDGIGTIGVITYDDIQLNNKGQAAFSSQMVSPTYGGADGAVLRGDGQSLSVIARRGQSTPDGQLHYGFDGDSLPFYPTAINDSGQVAFQADLGDSSGQFAGAGIYVSDGIDTVEVTRPGRSLAGSTVSFVSWQAEGGFNSLGQVAYLANLADGRTGAFLYTLQDIHWRTAGSGNWDNNVNWTLSTTPGFVHDISIDPNAGVTVSGPAADVTVRSLAVGKTAGGLVTLNLHAGANLTATNSISLKKNSRLGFEIGGTSPTDFGA